MVRSLATSRWKRWWSSVEEYTINGNKVKLLNDNATYWGTQVEIDNGRCFGIACDEHYILVSEYGKDSADAELVILKKR